LEREAAGLEHAPAHVLGNRAEMRVARRQLGPCVADADHRPTVELVLRKAAVLEPGAVVETHLVLACEPRLAAQLLSAHGSLVLLSILACVHPPPRYHA